jgi:carbon-monoxide dehydrogenase medium subunit
MKPAPFVYHRVDYVDEAVERLAELGTDAKLLAGGQSLLPMMNFRLVRPSALIDITRVSSLRGVTRAGDELRVGALTRHHDLMRAPVGRGYDILASTAPLIGHEPIRSCGTFGGSLAHADPAAEWCTLLLLLDGSVVLRSIRDERLVSAAELFHGFLVTDIADDELLVEARFPRPVAAAAIEEEARRPGDFALVLAGAALEWHEGCCRSARLVVGGVAETPMRLLDAERVVEGSALDDDVLRECAEVARRSVDPPTDAHATAGYRRRLAGALVVAALRAARARADAQCDVAATDANEVSREHVVG